MLSESTLQNLIQAIVDRQENINTWVIKKIAKRIREIGEVLPSDVNQLDRLLKTGSDVRLINQEISRLTGIQLSSIQDLIRTVAEDAYLDTEPFFNYRKLPFVPFEENKQLQNVVKAIARQTSDTYRNLSKAQAFMLRDPANPQILKPTPIADAYQSVVDEAVQASQGGVVDYRTAMRKTMRQLVDSGIRSVTYNTETGRIYTQRLDTAVRRNVLDGIRAINQGVQDEVGKQFGANGKEITVHACPAPDHEDLQGRQFSNEEFEKLQNEEPFKDYTGKQFTPVARAIGTCNCRHFTFSVILGVNKPTHSQEELKKIIDANDKGYTLPNGKHLTMYECTQMQRKLETQVRKAKDGQIAARTAGDMELAKKYQKQINEKQAEYIAFSNACGLQPMKMKMTVSGYRKISTK